MSKILIKKIHLASLSTAFIGLLFPINISSLCIVLFILFSIIKLLLFKNEIPKKLNKKVLLFSGFYSLYLLGLFYTNNFKVSQQILERNVSWLLIPLLIFYSINPLDKKTFFKTILPFAVTTQIFALFYLLTAIYNFYLSGNSLMFYYENLTSYTNFHPVYFALYFGFSGLIILFGVKEKYIKLSLFLKIVFVSFNYILLILLSSKSLIFLLLIFTFFYLKKYLKKRKEIFLLPLIIITLLIGIFSFSNTRDRINDAIFSKWELLQKDQFLYNDAFTGVTLRLITWKFVTKKLFSQENILIGVGTGDSQDFIDGVYKDHNMDAAGYLGFNMHNQFLEYFVRFGLLGLFYFLLIVVICFKQAILHKNDLHLWFLVFFLSVSITESTLEVHRGIVFFTLFNFFLFFNSKKTSL